MNTAELVAKLERVLPFVCNDGEFVRMCLSEEFCRRCRMLVCINGKWSYMNFNAEKFDRMIRKRAQMILVRPIGVQTFNICKGYSAPQYERKMFNIGKGERSSKKPNRSGAHKPNAMLRGMALNRGDIERNRVSNWGIIITE